MNKPHIVFITNYFYPDFASVGQLLTELCLHLQHDFNITVIAAQPNYAGEEINETKKISTDELDTIRIIRIKLPKVDKRNKLSRLRYIAAYFFCAIRLLIQQKDIHLIYSISQPPILGGLIGTIGKAVKRCKHIYNIQDFNPEQAQVIGFIKNKFIMRTAKWLDMLNCKHADHIVTVGYDMQQTLIKRFAKRAVTENSVINNWTNEEEIIPLIGHPAVSEFRKRNGLEGKFIVMYSGNLGLYYDLENIIRITHQFKENENLAFVFIGEGAVKKQMQDYINQHGISNVQFLPYQTNENLKYSLNAADVHLVVNQKGIKGVSVPSKIYGIMAAGKSILGVLEKESEAHRIIEESRCGFVVEPQQYDEIVSQIKRLFALNRKELADQGIRGRHYLEQHLRKDLSLEKYRRLFLSMSNG